MVTANIENEGVSVQLQNNESVTVPTGETWAVEVTVGPLFAIDSSSSRDIWVWVNGSLFLSNMSNPTRTTVKTLFDSGDTIRVNAEDDAGAHIGGIVVNS